MEYHDKLVQITKEYILFHHYYFPFGSKQIKMDQIKEIKVFDPTLSSGKYRIHGTGDFRTWFPCDVKRASRDRIFVITKKKGWVRIGFTVEQSNLALLIFEKLGLIAD